MIGRSGRRLVSGAAFLLVGIIVAGCADAPHRGSVAVREGPPPELPSCEAVPRTVGVEEVAGGLEVPWDLAPASDGRIFLTERPGRIRVIEDGVLREEPWFEFEVEHGDEIGLMGIALAPDFDATGHLFVVTSHFRPEPAGGLPVLGWALRRIRNRLPGDGGTSIMTRVQRVTDRDGRGTDPTLWADGLPAAILHAGGALLPRADGWMLLTLGDAMDPWSAQDPRSLRGSILRIPLAVPDAGGHRIRPAEHLVALGVRNSQGLGFLGADSSAVAFIDHGPSGLPVEEGRSARDELNVLVRGGNYGWPVEAGIHEEPRFLPPVAEWTPALAPAGMATLPGDGAGGDPLESTRVFVAGLRGQALEEVVMRRDGEGWFADCRRTLLGDEWGRLRAVAVEAGGELLVSTSNRDGRGVPREGDDRILRLRLETSPEPAADGTNLDASALP